MVPPGTGEGRRRAPETTRHHHGCRPGCHLRPSPTGLSDCLSVYCLSSCRARGPAAPADKNRHRAGTGSGRQAGGGRGTREWHRPPPVGVHEVRQEVVEPLEDRESRGHVRLRDDRLGEAPAAGRTDEPAERRVGGPGDVRERGIVTHETPQWRRAHRRDPRRRPRSRPRGPGEVKGTQECQEVQVALDPDPSRPVPSRPSPLRRPSQRPKPRPRILLHTRDVEPRTHPRRPPQSLLLLLSGVPRTRKEETFLTRTKGGLVSSGPVGGTGPDQFPKRSDDSRRGKRRDSGIKTPRPDPG